MRFLQLSLLLLVTLAATSHAIRVNCLFRNAFWAGENLRTCFANNVTESCPCADPDEQEELNIANPEDLPAGQTEDELEGVHIRDWKLPKFPKRLWKRFKKLKALEFDNCELEAVTDEDFRGLTVLVYVSFPRNRFRMLPGRLFRHVPQLRWVKFHGNSQLRNIGFNLFKHLQFLRELNLGGAGCAGSTVVTDRSLLNRIAGQLMNTCPPDADDFEEDMENMECVWNDSKSSDSKGN